MKIFLRLIMSLALFLLITADVPAQRPQSAAQSVEQLHQQFYELQRREASLRERLNELNVELVPENIARAVSGFGSTRPEELRANRRRLLENEKTNIVAQLNEIEKSRDRLAYDIRLAEAAAYNESARVTTSDQVIGAIGTKAGGIPRWMVGSLAAAISLFAIVGIASLVRKRRKSVNGE